jgi:hypothetical protein
MLFDILGAMAALQATGGDDGRRRTGPYNQGTDPFVENRSRDQNFRAGLQPSSPGYGPNLPQGYGRAAHLATGGGQGGVAYNPSEAYYGTPEAAATRQEGRALMQQYGFNTPDYMNEMARQPTTPMASPMTNAMVSGPPSGNDPIREQMVWQYNNPNARRAPGSQTVSYSGNAGDGGMGMSMADQGLYNQQMMARDLERYDKTQAEKGLASANAEHARSAAGLASAQANAVPGQLRAEEGRVKAQQDEAKARLMDAQLNQEVIRRGQANGMTPLAPGAQPPLPSAAASQMQQDTKHGGNALLGIINGNPNGYLSDVLAKLDAQGAFADPSIAPTVAAALRFHWGPEMDRIMAGGSEGGLSRLNPTNILGGFGLWGQNNGRQAYGAQLDVTRRRIAALFPHLYQETTPAAPAYSPPEPSGFGGFGSY